MCTVAVVPSPGGGYLLGHNRDESVRRAPGAPPSLRRAGESSYLAPADPEGGGTWITVNESGVTTCLLNAAEDDPSRLPATPRSRGRIARDLAGARDPQEFRSYFGSGAELLAATRSFHLVVVVPGPGRPRVHRFGWDGRRWDERQPEPPCLFVSCLPFPVEAEQARGASFRAFLEATPAPGPEALAAWLANHDPEPGALSTCVHREGVRTVSRTVVHVDAGAAVMFYGDGSPCEARGPGVPSRLALRTGS